MNEIFFVVSIVFILLLILSFLLLYIIKRINLLMKNNFINKLNEFDFLIGDKEQKIQNLNQNILEKEKVLEKINEKIKDSNNINERIDNNDIVLPKYADFEDGNLLSGYKIIKEKFNFDIKKILNKFIEEQKNDKLYLKYNAYIKIRSYFTYDVIYKLLSFQSNEQKLIVINLLDENDRMIIDDILNKRKFNILKFIDDLDELIIKTNPEIKIYVGREQENYNYLNPNIKTIYDANITEGFKILHRGIVYDYSI